MNMEYYQTEDKITEKEFQEFEKKIGFSFPESFKSHYLENNGGSPSKPYFEGRGISFFYPIKYSTQGDNIDQVYEKLKEQMLVKNTNIGQKSSEGHL